MRVIAERTKPFNIRFKGPGHNHRIEDYTSIARPLMLLKNDEMDEKNLIEKSHMGIESDME
jgi:hypothetical protein